MSYGRHQSFYLKKHWINKGIKALQIEREDILIDKNGFKRLGIGKNMQQALRYWLEATKVVEIMNDRQGHKLSGFGDLIRENDSSCTYMFSLLMLHYYLVTSMDGDKPFSHAFDWFFLHNDDYALTKEQMKIKLMDYDADPVSENTITRDIDCLIQLYTNNSMSHPEDKNVALFADIGLVKKDRNVYIKASPSLSTSLALVLYFGVIEKRNNINLDIESITKEVGSIFNLNRTDVINLIEILIERGFNIDITRTNNLDTVTVKERRKSDRLLTDLYKEAMLSENEH